jgi:hypothetical protein
MSTLRHPSWFHFFYSCTDFRRVFSTVRFEYPDRKRSRFASYASSSLHNQKRCVNEEKAHSKPLPLIDFPQSKCRKNIISHGATIKRNELWTFLILASYFINSTSIFTLLQPILSKGREDAMASLTLALSSVVRPFSSAIKKTRSTSLCTRSNLPPSCSCLSFQLQCNSKSSSLARLQVSFSFVFVGIFCA